MDKTFTEAAESYVEHGGQEKYLGPIVSYLEEFFSLSGDLHPPQRVGWKGCGRKTECSESDQLVV